MTRCKVELGPDILVLQAQGHATGSEQVCAAVSAITLSLLGYALNIQARGEGLVSQQKAEPGEFYLRASGDARLRGAFEMAKQGLLQLENSFPQYIAVER